MIKAVVFPFPDWACPIKLRGLSLFKLRGRASSCMADGRSNPISRRDWRRWDGRFNF